MYHQTNSQFIVCVCVLFTDVVIYESDEMCYDVMVMWPAYLSAICHVCVIHTIWDNFEREREYRTLSEISQSHVTYFLARYKRIQTVDRGTDNNVH